MAKSLQEQLLQSGAAKPKQAKKARREKAAGRKAARRQATQPADDQALQQEIAAAEAAKRERDRRLNAELKQQREVHERDQAVAQIIERNRVPSVKANDEDTVAYNYTIEGRIRRLAVSDRQRRDLAAGRLAVVRHDAQSFLVGRAAALRIAQMRPESLWLVTPDDAPPAEDDPYADFPVPDDLMW